MMSWFFSDILKWCTGKLEAFLLAQFLGDSIEGTHTLKALRKPILLR